MPPASPAATRVLRIASSSVVLPWSTWPMTVTMGGRETRVVSESSSCSSARDSTSISVPRDTMSPMPTATAAASSPEIGMEIEARIPRLIKSLMTATLVVSSSSAKSPTVITSGMLTAESFALTGILSLFRLLLTPPLPPRVSRSSSPLRPEFLRASWAPSRRGSDHPPPLPLPLLAVLPENRGFLSRPAPLPLSSPPVAGTGFLFRLSTTAVRPKPLPLKPPPPGRCPPLGPRCPPPPPPGLLRCWKPPPPPPPLQQQGPVPA
mmetsp:Transcript_4577/g.12014  ORF Transcript_4577/g.12014 Transcript_4577/m.12014 type:complete len:264 (-) Transcript_4577:1734-2525(-)